MLLTLDVGNTQTVVGVYENGAAADAANAGLLATWRISTVHERTEDEWLVVLRSLMVERGWNLDSFSGVAASSGVPTIAMLVRRMVDRYFDFEPVIIGPGVKSGISIQYDNPKEVGADRIANSVAAFDLFGGPSVVVDFGTGTTLDAVSKDGAYLGGSISPGVEISLDALVGRAAALRAVELVEPRSPIGKSTVEALQSGALYGFAGAVDALVSRFEEVMGESTVIATGGLAELIAPHTKTIEHVEPWLTLHGLRLIWHKNQD